MKACRRNAMTVVLAVGVACASVGCASEPPIPHPTRETFTTYLQDGDKVEVVVKEGMKREFTITRMDADAVWGDPAGALHYADLASVRVVSRAAPADARDGGTTYEGRAIAKTAKTLGIAVAVVVVVPAVVVGGICGLGGLAASSRHW